MKIAIWGMGVSGESALNYLSKKKDVEVYLINNGNPKSWTHYQDYINKVNADRCFSETDAAVLVDILDLIIMSPGIDPRKEELKPFKKIKKICEVELAYQNIDIPIIAVTGTNGKTTTVTMITKALELAGKRVFLGGNIGTPFCDIFLSEEKFDYAVLELSSFQLELMEQFRANVAVILNITKSHMERYDSLEDYQNAKINITNNQTSSDLYIAPKEFLGHGEAIKKELDFNEEYDFEHSELIGDHYKINIDAVDKIISFFELENHIQNLINTFKGVSYRLEFLKEYRGTKIYNDGKSTNSAATESALKSFKGKRVCLFLGGKLRDKTQDFSFISSNVHVYAFGEAKDYIAESITGTKCFENIKEALDAVNWGDFDVLLFSPSFPSFDQYKNYIERAEDFEKLVSLLS